MRALVSLLILVCAASAVRAETYYVATGGSDGGDGSSDDPWRTLQHAVGQVAPGDEIVVRAGTYAGARIETSGTAQSPIVLRAHTGAVVTLNQPSPDAAHDSILEVENFSETVTDWILEGFEILGAGRSGVDIRIARRITVRGNRVSGSGRTGIFTAFADRVVIEDNQSFANGEHGVYTSNSGDSPIVRRNLLFDNAGSGVHMNADASQGGDGVISRARVDQNVIFGNGAVLGGSGINMDGVERAKVRNNLIFGEHASGISLFQIDGAVCTSHTLVANNTVITEADGRWAFNMPDAGCVGNRVINNILLSGHSFRGSVAIYSPTADGFESHHNVVMDRFSIDGGDTVIDLAAWQALGHGAASQIASESELFVDAASGDYELAPDSPARDAGETLRRVRRDLEGRRRATPFDVGAYESWP